MTVPPPLRRYRQELEEELRSLLERPGPPLLYRMARYHLGWEDAEGKPLAQGGGKALRPALCLLAAEALGGDWRQALPAATALELVHNFSLVHDDIQDQDRERRHRPTVWAVWGQAQAINAGDALLALAQAALARLKERGVPAEKVVSASRILAEATLEMVEGQVLDLQFEAEGTVGLELYLDMISRKTGALFDAALRLGALVASNSPAVWEAMGRCGRLLGVAFQVRDDALGVWGTSEQTGKPAGADIRRHKKSLPIIYGLAAEGPQGEVVRSVYRKSSLDENDVAQVMTALESLRAREYCQGLARDKKREALSHLEGLPLVEERRQELVALADFLLERES